MYFVMDAASAMALMSSQSQRMITPILLAAHRKCVPAFRELVVSERQRLECLVEGQCTRNCIRTGVPNAVFEQVETLERRIGSELSCQRCGPTVRDAVRSQRQELELRTLCKK